MSDSDSTPTAVTGHPFSILVRTECIDGELWLMEIFGQTANVADPYIDVEQPDGTMVRATLPHCLREQRFRIGGTIVPHPDSTAVTISNRMQGFVLDVRSESRYSEDDTACKALLREIATLEANKEWWIGEARGILTALCREDTRVIERVTRRVLIIRDEEGRSTHDDAVNYAFLKAVEERANV